jgi:hypothetical protein
VLLDDAAVLILVLDDDELAAVGGNGAAGEAKDESGGYSNCKVMEFLRFGAGSTSTTEVLKPG